MKLHYTVIIEILHCLGMLFVTIATTP